LGNRWAYHALHPGRCYGLEAGQLRRLYAEADLIVNLHGGTVPLPEHYATGRLVYLGTDPVDREVELHDNVRATVELLEPHRAFFPGGLNQGRPDCRVPAPGGFPFRPMPPPVLMDIWASVEGKEGECFTTVGNWKQLHRRVTYGGKVYHWSKHAEFLKFIDL